jgi:hypothetical protein
LRPVLGVAPLLGHCRHQLLGFLAKGRNWTLGAAAEDGVNTMAPLKPSLSGKFSSGG